MKWHQQKKNVEPTIYLLLTGKSSLQFETRWNIYLMARQKFKQNWMESTHTESISPVNMKPHQSSKCSREAIIFSSFKWKIQKEQQRKKITTTNKNTQSTERKRLKSFIQQQTTVNQPGRTLSESTLHFITRINILKLFFSSSFKFCILLFFTFLFSFSLRLAKLTSLNMHRILSGTAIILFVSLLLKLLVSLIHNNEINTIF